MTPPGNGTGQAPVSSAPASGRSRAVRVPPALAVLGACLLASACTISTGHHDPGTDHTVATAPPAYDTYGAPKGPTLTITIAGGRVTPAPGRAEVVRGHAVRLVVTSDTADELHVHGFDLTRPLEPGRPVTVDFIADRTGLFEVETHGSGLVLTQLLVR
ncbi:hypothetical protein GCM10010156_24410 [Planobispora rosea]|uniref:EfeO-type cupredoxin-like domain-containing protein n=1 Tax=Planobispora rosea TaxID=35762 RepID=A0A8J3WCU8_PLARO|nr:hypothetical protein [Planobispora rosea]GGS64438.1 hypothetical protein GCM10010156_24410 [Planobispora rosea]GIH84605.1 hypothetical protein Pro02_30130 [Planobispora rosea]